MGHRVRKSACVIEGPSPAESLLFQPGTSCDIWPSTLWWHAMWLFLKVTTRKWSTPEGSGGERALCGGDGEAGVSGKSCHIFCPPWDLAASCPWTHPGSDSLIALVGVN